MTNRIRCRTLFDITATGVRSHYKESRIPFYDDSGKMITNIEAWHHARNQQRNWETINQILALRTLPQEISVPVVHDKTWTFEFAIDELAAISEGDNFASLLLADCDSVPMIIGLNESASVSPMLQPNVNIWFEPA